MNIVVAFALGLPLYVLAAQGDWRAWGGNLQYYNKRSHSQSMYPRHTLGDSALSLTLQSCCLPKGTGLHIWTSSLPHQWAGCVDRWTPSFLLLPRAWGSAPGTENQTQPAGANCMQNSMQRLEAASRNLCHFRTLTNTEVQDSAGISPIRLQQKEMYNGITELQTCPVF